MIIRRYDDTLATDAHSGTIRAHEVLPKHESFAAPFGSAWGFIQSQDGQLETHSHPTEEVYIVFKGSGIVTVGDESEAVECGDVIEIPASVPHSIKNNGSEPLLWLAFWWER